jgi:phosphoribosylglycinamide formyltransferase-1
MPRRSGAKLGVLASGRGSNFVALADASLEGRLGGELVVLISDRDDAPVLERGRERGIPALHLEPGKYRTRLSDEAEARYVATLRERGDEVVLLAGSMRAIHEKFLDAFPDAVINVHPSLLPAFPGLKAPKQALEHGVAVAGCTIHLVNENVDGGFILAQGAVPVHADDDEDSLTHRIQDAEHRLYPETVRRYLTEPFAIRGRRVIWGEE